MQKKRSSGSRRWVRREDSKELGKEALERAWGGKGRGGDGQMVRKGAEVDEDDPFTSEKGLAAEGRWVGEQRKWVQSNGQLAAL